MTHITAELYIYSLFHILFHDGLSQDIEYSSLCSTVGSCCLSILYILVCIYQPQTPNPSLSHLATTSLFSVSVILFLFHRQVHLCHILNLFILFIYFWLCWVFVAVCGLSLVVASRGYSSLWCVGFSLRWLLLLQSTGSRRAGFSSCGMRAQ